MPESTGCRLFLNSLQPYCTAIRSLHSLLPLALTVQLLTYLGTTSLSYPSLYPDINHVYFSSLIQACQLSSPATFIAPLTVFKFARCKLIWLCVWLLGLPKNVTVRLLHCTALRQQCTHVNTSFELSAKRITISSNLHHNPHRWVFSSVGFAVFLWHSSGVLQLFSDCHPPDRSSIFNLYAILSYLRSSSSSRLFLLFKIAALYLLIFGGLQLPFQHRLLSVYIRRKHVSYHLD